MAQRGQCKLLHVILFGITEELKLVALCNLWFTNEYQFLTEDDFIFK